MKSLLTSSPRYSLAALFALTLLVSQVHCGFFDSLSSSMKIVQGIATGMISDEFLLSDVKLSPCDER